MDALKNGDVVADLWQPRLGEVIEARDGEFVLVHWEDEAEPELVSRNELIRGPAFAAA